MTRMLVAALAAAAALTITLDAHAVERQLHLSPLIGGGAGFGTLPVAFGSVGFQAGYGITDAFRIHGTVDYRIGANLADGALTQLVGGSVGVGYALDVLSVVPWVALEVGAHAAIDANVRFVPSGTARLGVDWLLSRYFGLTFQGGYSLGYVDAGLAHTAFGSVGTRWAFDL